MEDTLLIDAAERFARGEMSAEEKIFFEELRKQNPELDQLVVEQLFFLNELERYGNTKNFKHILQETEAKLVQDVISSDNAQSIFETSVSCIGASTCQVGLRDSQALLQNCIQAVRQANPKFKSADTP